MFYTLIITYILGGLTLVPLIVAGLVAFAFYTSTPIDTPKHPKLQTDTSTTTANQRTPSLKSWLTVRRTFEASPSSYISLVRTLLDSRSAHPRRAEDAFFAVLKGKVLYLYEDEAMSECAEVIDVGRCHVNISPEGVLLDGELFAKRNAVVIREIKKENPDDDAQPQEPWFIFFRSVTLMEDWYLALLAVSTDLSAESFAPFPQKAHQALIDSLDALPDLIPTRWLNALLGRLFLGVKGTKAVEAWVLGRLMKKLSKVKTPSWLTAVVVRSFDAGDVAPVLSKPMLKELTPEGEASVGVDVSYIAPADGGIRITLSATVTISLPTTPSLSLLGIGFKKDPKEKEVKEKPYEVSLVLAVIVKRVEGNMLVKIKRPPSNRLWYAFTTMPRLDVEVVPVVSDRQIRWGMVLGGIEGKLREIIQDSVVLPNMDDVPFFDSTPYPLRGGIFADAFAAQSFMHPSEGHTGATATTASEEGRTAEDAGVGEEKAAEVQRTHSVDVLVREDEDEKGPDPQPQPEPEPARADTIGPGVQAETRRRKSWFGGRKSEDGEEGTGGHRRGRSDEGPGVRVLVTAEQDDDDDDDDSDASDHEHEDAPMSPRRHTFRSVSISESSSASGPTPASPRAGLSTSAPSSTPPPAPATSGFLSTLKSGMAEKQPALKEAMRKWGVGGVNWAAGLRRGGAREGSGGNELHARDGSGDRRVREGSTDGGSGDDRHPIDRGDAYVDAEADHGDGWGGRSASPRGSYADLRKKVEQRERERSRDPGTSEGGTATKPIDIPGAALQRRSSATSSVRRTSPPASFLSPSAPKTTTELHTTPRAASPAPLRSTSSTPPPHAPASSNPTPDKSALPAALDQPVPAAPIQAQPPKAATMMIPGIHARHKGEMMGFGSPAPEPSAAPPDGQQGKAMQSVYKLFKSKSGTGAGDGEGEPRARTASMPVTMTPSRGTGPPPPLPPRTPVSTSEDPASPPTSARMSPASQALKSVAELDAAARQPPPLPSRRASMSPVQSPSAGETVFDVPDEGAPRAQENGGWKPPLPPRSHSMKVKETPGVT